MGYYVNTTEVDFFLYQRHFDAVYKRMCDLNDYHDLKSGGSFGGNEDLDPNERYPKNKWFAWMPYNYPETCKDMFEILQHVGFDWTIDDEGNMSDIRYENNKTGAEDYFLSCFAGYVDAESYVCFEGEDGNHWKYYFNNNGEMELHNGIVEIHWKYADTYHFGEMSNTDKQLLAWKQEWDRQRALEKESALEK